MSDDPISRLGLSCHSGGTFYICQDSEVAFLGCCDVDPCSNNGTCPSPSVAPARFDPDKYEEIPAQSCVSSSKGALWYTCTAGPTFIGCCASNACENGGVCPADDLVGAVLNLENPNDASAFLTTAKSTSTSTIDSITNTATATPTTSPAPDGADRGGSSPYIGGIVGGILGGLVTLCLIAFIAFHYGKRKRGLVITRKPGEDPSPTSPPPPWSPYHDTFARNGAPLTPMSAASTATSSHKSPWRLSSIVGFKRMSAKSRESRVSGDHELDPARFLNPVAELDSAPPGAIHRPGSPHDNVYYEILGSMPEPHESRPMAS
ncbi:hypothetical protein F4861DRAFT_180296 [Xylaria intraflava]|nr:hypothetical protein F4861DRAFT_180296 [Xylaria intraflava]